MNTTCTTCNREVFKNANGGYTDRAMNITCDGIHLHKVAEVTSVTYIGEEYPYGSPVIEFRFSDGSWLACDTNDLDTLADDLRDMLVSR